MKVGWLCGVRNKVDHKKWMKKERMRNRKKNKNLPKKENRKKIGNGREYKINKRRALKLTEEVRSHHFNVKTMRRGSSKKTGQSNSLPFNASHKSSSKESDRIDQFFYTYANKLSGTIDPEGIEALCSDMGVDHTDVRILMLAWKMQAEKQGYFTLEEWRKGLKALRAETIAKLTKALPELEKEVKRTTNFEDFYQYAFRYCLTEDRQKSIDIESICQLLDLVLGSQFRAQVDYFVEYLNTQTDYKVMNMDQWMGFYRFCNEISFPDFSNYDQDHAWPLILDNFVDWMKAKQN